MTKKVRRFKRPPVPDFEKEFEKRVEYKEQNVAGVHSWEVRADNLKEKPDLLFYVHGGGFMRPHNEYDTALSAEWAVKTGNLVVDVDYLLAPANPYPAAVNQIYDLVKYYSDNAAEIGFNRIILLGCSSGGNNVASVAMRAKESKDFEVALLITCYPPMDLVTDPADREDAELSHVPPEVAVQYNRQYADEETAKSPFVSMALAKPEELQGMPPLVMLTAGKDALHSEAETFAHHMMQAGNLVTIKRFLNSPHSFVAYLMGEWEQAHQLIVQQINDLD